MPGAAPANPAQPPDITPVPDLTSPGPVQPPVQGGLAPPTGAVAPATGSARDPNSTPPAPPGAGPATPAVAQVFVTPPGTEFRVAGGPYTVPLSINNASRVSVITLTVTFNPNVLRVRQAQDGTFMRQGGVPTTFTPRIDAVAGRVDIAVTRTGDQAGASGSGLLSGLVFDAVGPGGSLIQVSGVATTPEGSPVTLQFSPVTVTVR